MIRYFYVVKDDVAGSFDWYGDYVNDAVACRAFKNTCNNSPVPVGDFSLYRVCGFDTYTGSIVEPKCDFIMRGEKSEI